MTRERERENPLPPDAWVELVGQFDESDDARAGTGCADYETE